ncbi:MAG TPA: hypothetical protein PLP25_06135 [Candidatus Limiplasma sp.]|nr:hypothetical protein [Candidatus Limiplasma sp.]HPS81420.1 hypothetical protein [Candidatus Limiplasma sp.]
MEWNPNPDAKANPLKRANSPQGNGANEATHMPQLLPPETSFARLAAHLPLPLRKGGFLPAIPHCTQKKAGWAARAPSQSRLFGYAIESPLEN